MMEETQASLSPLLDQPGLAFYTAYTHVQDVSTHLNLTTIHHQCSGSAATDPYDIATLSSCIPMLQELLLGLLYRSDVVDSCLVVDKFALGLSVGDIFESLDWCQILLLPLLSADSIMFSQWWMILIAMANGIFVASARPSITQHQHHSFIGWQM